MKKIIIVGAGGHGKVIADIASKCGYTDIMFIDDNSSVKTCMGCKVIGGLAVAECYKDSDYIVAIGNAKLRERIQQDLILKGMNVVTLIHPSAVIGMNVTIGVGTVIMAGAVVNPDSKIGDGCIINTSSSVDHDNEICDYAHISVGSHLAGTVRIGKYSWVGAGAVVSNNISICDECMIGAGAVVVKNIDVSGTYVGIPCLKIK